MRRDTPWWGALGGLVLLLVFIAGISINLARGRQPDCHCFGQLYSEPVGWPTLLRNGLLAAAAGFVVWQGQDAPGPSAVSWIGNMTGGQIVGLISAVVILSVLTAEGWFVLHLLRQNGRLLLRMEELEQKLGATGMGQAPTTLPPHQPAAGLPVGATAPTFQLPLLSGDTLTLDALRAEGKPVLLIFSDPGCGPCTALLPDAARWQREHAAVLTLALISRGTEEANHAKVARHNLTRVLLQRDREVAETYEAHGTPSAVLIQPDGTIGTTLAMGAQAIEDLVARTVGSLLLPAPTIANGKHNGAVRMLTPASLKIGEIAPAFKLPDLDGASFDSQTFRGHETLMLFWNPGCGYCNRMLPELKDWEAKLSEGAPKLLLVSTGTIEENRALGLRSSVVLDQNFSTGRMFGVDGTPSAVLIDRRGNIASQVAVGAPAVLTLAGIRSD